MEDRRQVVLLIKELIEKGYKDKHICMITHAKQPYVSKVRNGKIHVNTVLQENEKLEMTEDQVKRLDVINRILSIPELTTPGTSEQDLYYIQVLKFFMVDKEDVIDLYIHLSKNQVRNYWRKKDVNILKFNSELIGVPHKVYLDCIIDYFI